MSLIIKTKIFDHDRVDYKVVTRTLRPFCQQRGMKTKNAELFLCVVDLLPDIAIKCPERPLCGRPVADPHHVFC